jgi:hypothetical protein
MAIVARQMPSSPSSKNWSGGVHPVHPHPCHWVPAEGGLIPGNPRCDDAQEAGGYFMTSGAGIRLAAITAVLLVAGCSSMGSTACQCPKPVTYDDATIAKITAALRALPPDNVLHEAMDDYEDERDDLRFCRAAGH